MFTCFLISGFVFAQPNFSLNGKYLEGFDDIDWKGMDHELNINPVEISTQLSQLNLGWELIRQDLPNGWDYKVCIDGDCQENAKSGPISVTRSQPTGFSVQTSSNNIVGLGTMTFRIFEIDQPKSSDTFTLNFFLMDKSLGLEEEVPPYDFNIFPNPCSSNLKISFTRSLDSSFKIKIFNLVGQEQRDIEVVTYFKSVSIDLHKLNNGTYLVQFVSPDGKINTRRFTKKA